MNNLTIFSVTTTTETALKKLSKANIAVFNLKKRGATLLFGVHDANIKKVFAIFAHPCYNVNVKRKSDKNSLISFALNRIGILLGCALFAVAIALSDGFIFKISVTGSGSYLKNEVLAIMQAAGVRSGAFYKGLDKPLVLSRIMSLPQVTFCSVSKQGSVVIVDVQVDEEHTQSARYSPLKCDVSGIVRSVVAICGTAEVAVGQSVSVGDTLIGAYEADSEGASLGCLVVGYVQIEASAQISCAAAEDNEQNAAAALSSVLLYSDELVSRDYTVKRTAEGVVYEINFTYLHTLSVNME